jgi:transposase
LFGGVESLYLLFAVKRQIGSILSWCWENATAIHASNPRKEKTDKRDARHLLRLLVEDRFLAVWQPGLANERLRQLLLHRSRLVRMRTRVENQLDSLGKNEGLVGAGDGRERPSYMS